VHLYRQTTRVLQCFSPQLGTPHFLSSDPVISRMNLQKSPEQDGQDTYPGNDDNEDAPIGYFIVRGDLADMGVIHQ
jgi:hypothetical protein